MNVSPSREAEFLNRRADRRVPFRNVIRFVSDPKRPLRLRKGITQNLSLRGVSMLSSSILESVKPFEIWLPLDEEEMVSALAKLAWVSLEDNLGDSPYWIRGGLALTFRLKRDHDMVLDLISDRSKADIVEREESRHKIGFAI